MNKYFYFFGLFLIVGLITGTFVYQEYGDIVNIENGLQQCILLTDKAVEVVWSNSCD